MFDGARFQQRLCEPELVVEVVKTSLLVPLCDKLISLIAHVDIVNLVDFPAAVALDTLNKLMQ